MGLIKDLKNKAGLYFLNREKESKRKIETRNFELATSVGILFEAKSESDFILVKQYRKHLQSEFGIKTVNAFGWIDAKVLPDYATLHRGFIFINQENVNWYCKPNSDDYKEFVLTQFDILIDLTFEAVLPLRFTLKNAIAKMKVGRYHAEDYKLYDLTLNLKENALLDEYIRQTDKYLKLIKP